MRKTTDTIHRLLLLLNWIPRLPHKVDAATLHARVREAGIEVELRTIQRDLVNLSRMFPIVNDERFKPLGWSWAQDATIWPTPVAT
ncbi:MAG: hypothetical protein JXR83_01260 [Deltaproteobacteria bacterium]|nr:hypothetical protein [Deltaproteobacteria bacterium]